MENKYIFSISTEKELTPNDFDVELFKYNPELCCDGDPQKVIKNFEDLLSLMDEWEE
jgi:hypothetical protein